MTGFARATARTAVGTMTVASFGAVTFTSADKRAVTVQAQQAQAADLLAAAVPVGEAAAGAKVPAQVPARAAAGAVPATVTATLVTQAMAGATTMAPVLARVTTGRTTAAVTAQATVAAVAALRSNTRLRWVTPAGRTT